VGQTPEEDSLGRSSWLKSAGDGVGRCPWGGDAVSRVWCVDILYIPAVCSYIRMSALRVASFDSVDALIRRGVVAGGNL
jgi:hypothetical protein